MSVYTPSKIQDLAKSMLEVQERIKIGVKNRFLSSKSQETFNEYLS